MISFRYFAGLTLLSVVCGLCMDVAYAQEEKKKDQRQGQRRGGRGFPGGRRGQEIHAMMLIRNAKVQKELKMDEDAKKEVMALFKKFEGESRGAGGRGGFGAFQDLTPEERQKLFTEMAKKRQKVVQNYAAKLQTHLNEKQSKRLQEIEIQHKGIRALNDNSVAEALKLTKEQRKKVRTAFREQQRKQTEMFRGLFQGGGGDFAAIREKSQKLQKETETIVLAVLTDEQKKKFESMKGEKIELDLRQGRGRGGFGGFGGARPDRPQRPQRPE